jgi:hypothetical protein
MNPYIQIMINALFTGAGVALGNWFYDAFLKYPLNTTHKNIKRLIKVKMVRKRNMD